MRFLFVSLLFLVGCSDRAITPEHVKKAVEACKNHSTWKTIEKDGNKLWVVCADDVPMNVSLSGKH